MPRARDWLLVDASYGLAVQKDDDNPRVRDDDHARKLLYRDARAGKRAAIRALIELAEDRQEMFAEICAAQEHA